MVVGPDGDLYAADDQGYIYRYVINPDGTLGASKTIRTVIDNNVYTGTGEISASEKGERLICGMAFDPTSSAKHPVLWITSGFPAVAGSPDWSGKVSVLSGKNLTDYKDVVVNLPRSFKDHNTEGISFGPDGMIYISQASNSAMGAPDPTWDNRDEHLLNDSILRLDPSKITSYPLDVKTDSGGTYDPTAKNAPLTIYADGIRNAYQPVWTDDGFLLAPTNGSSSGGNSPGGQGIPAETDLPTQPDYLYNVVKGGYYGHPNATQGHYVENGGNPTSGVDPGEVTAYPVGTQPDSDYKGFIYNFGNHESPDGAIEYEGNAFGGALNGDLLVAQYGGGNNIIALPRNGGTIKTSGVQQSIAGFTGFNEPLAIAEDNATGNIYVGQYGGKSIMLLRVNDKGLANAAEVASTQTQLLFNAAQGTSSTPLVDTLVNAGATELDISSFSLSGTNSNDFTITKKPNLPAALLPGQSTQVTVTFTPPSGTSAGLKTASLTVKSNDTGHPTFNIQLRGIVAASTANTDEPSLQSILNLYQIPVTVGDNDATTSTLQLPLQQPNDEINSQLFTRADASTPIEVDMLATFDTNASPVATIGSYSSVDGTESALLNINSGSNQTVNTAINGASTFFAGAKPFGMYVESDQHSHTIFSEDTKNTFDDSEPSDGHLVRVYPMKNTDGTTVANAYIVAVETTANPTVDNQDVVFEIQNVTPVPVISPNPPLPPTNLQVTNSVNSVTLDWDASTSQDIVGYVIKRSTNSRTNFIILNSSDVTGTSYTDTTPGKKKYYYRVFAVDAQNRFSDPAKVTTTVTAV
jgi:glucose/arabinose dehydrogenase